jgi:chemosensory pili system protein ChpA (sensor histidine kinase/response regulator)
MAGGKSEAGHITLDMRREGSELVLSVKDDGAGVNFDAVRGKAEKAGLLEPGSSVTRDELIDCLMQPGFSTADQINQVAGRGVGMDVVVEAVRAAGGSLSIESEPNLGTTFIIRLPFSLSITQALLFTAGGQTFAAPLAGVESMCRLEAEEVRAYLENGRGTVNVAGVDYDIHSLGALLGGSAPQSDDMDRHLPAMLIRSEGMNVALQVDEVLGSEEIVVKPVGPQVNSVPGLSGATILGDGRVVLILETAALVRNFVGRRSDEEAAAIREALRGSTEAPLKIMVIDDSITMRKVTSRLLERHGIDALLAKDGLDAAGQLEDVVPDAVVLDIEMPRMDGFELAAHIRNQEHLWHMPIIMVTSRSGEKHRQRAMDLGVNAYLGKPYREEELLSALRQVLGPRGERIPLQ